MRILDNRPSFYQWDTCQRVVHDFNVGDEVEFLNSQQKEPLMVTAYAYNGNVVADVPNILLQSATPITIYVSRSNESCRYTKEKYTIDVVQRPKPSDYVYTQTELATYDTLEKRVKRIEENGNSIDEGVVNRLITAQLEEAKESGAFNGKDGKDGYTPVKRIDYFTQSDVQEIVTQVIAGLPVYNGEAVDE